MRLCAHHSFTYDEIKAIAGGWGAFHCDHESHCGERWPLSFRPRLTNFFGDTLVSCWFSILCVVKGIPISMPALEAALAASEEPLCPHLRRNSPGILRLAQEVARDREKLRLTWHRIEEALCSHGSSLIASEECKAWHRRRDEKDFDVEQGAWISDSWSTNCRDLTLLRVNYGEVFAYERGCGCRIYVYMRRLPGESREEMILGTRRSWLERRTWLDASRLDASPTDKK
ncbi:uncharacterized protein BDZ99DRAFT_538491 [Mytilinidion resinicola]|uniref:Uncharacterized protein n=1 Tax=Mytilinidion resinicola TaxID=574789 RepID=A0A6A6YCI2_9PEZI|nr:uncharacterized protein BDZ99DRAFT_538491 [Mytilinidion resinicola]KAF2806288.1 hypothetical protein BDZ99DRAFT_538491 [Mytilinidion resinicola]